LILPGAAIFIKNLRQRRSLGIKIFYYITSLASLFLLLLSTSARSLAAEPFIESYFWPPGFFLSFGKLKQAQKEIMMSEVEKKVDFLRQSGKGLSVRGDLMDKLRPDVQELNPATILDQSGFVVLVRNFPNIYFNFNGPETLIRRNTFIVVKNPKVDKVESVIRQSLILTGDFFAFSQEYFKSTVENLQKALAAQSAQGQPEVQQPEKEKKKKRH
jgi:hypothetical protein